jgi:predicted adenylyl cyclase CyaB
VATNVEIKAQVKDLAALRERVEQLSDTPVELLVQEDTFFVVPKGRLKLRVLAPDRGQLVYYEREDRAGPKSSYYLVAPTPDPASLHAALAAALGVRGVVRKRRWLYLVGQTRVHLDDVEDLGAFVELEVVLQPGQSAEECQAIAADLMEQFGIASDDLIEVAYMDLLEARDSAGPA